MGLYKNIYRKDRFETSNFFDKLDKTDWLDKIDSWIDKLGIDADVITPNVVEGAMKLGCQGGCYPDMSSGSVGCLLYQDQEVHQSLRWDQWRLCRDFDESNGMGQNRRAPEGATDFSTRLI